jgi:threonine/homoserine/homoserine lactone efflux protein
MTVESWAALLSLAAAGALVPGPILVTVLLLRARGGVTAAAAFVAGMTIVRVVQGLVFGLLFSAADADGPAEPATIEAVLLLVLAILFYVAAGRSVLSEDDPDRPPPRWKRKIESMSSPGAFVFGAGYLLVGVKFWAFTLGAIAAIEEAAPGPGPATVAFIGFVILTQAIPLSILAAAILVPRRSAAGIGAISDWLERNDRALVIVLGLAFGTWFALQALSGLGVL